VAKILSRRQYDAARPVFRVAGPPAKIPRMSPREPVTSRNEWPETAP